MENNRHLADIYSADCGYTVSQWSDLLKSYPYFATARLGYARAVLNSKDEAPLNDIDIHAICFPQRETVYALLYPDAAAAMNAITSNPEKEEEVYEFIEDPCKDIEPVKTEEYSVMPLVITENFLQDITENTVKKDVETERRASVEIIEKFLAEVPRIIPKEAVDYEVDNSAGNQDDHPLVTETLAEIYAVQGLYGKTRQIYQILGLKYPEKSDYFANRIKDLPL